jgi:hypothetical protein
MGKMEKPSRGMTPLTALEAALSNLERCSNDFLGGTAVLESIVAGMESDLERDMLVFLAESLGSRACDLSAYLENLAKALGSDLVTEMQEDGDHG